MNSGSGRSATREERPIPQPITAIYSKSDAVVSWPAAIDHRSRKVTHIEVNAAHLGLVFQSDGLAPRRNCTAERKDGLVRRNRLPRVRARGITARVANATRGDIRLIDARTSGNVSCSRYEQKEADWLQRLMVVPPNEADRAA